MAEAAAAEKVGAPRRRWAWRVAAATATILWLLAWGRLGAVALTQPGPWHTSTWTLPGGVVADDNGGFRCAGHALQQGTVVYRTPCIQDDTGRARIYVVAFDLSRRTATVRWELPEFDFQWSDWPIGVARGPDGDLTIIGTDSTAIARLHADGRVERIAIPAEFLRGRGWRGSLFGFAWREDQLELLSLGGPLEGATADSLTLVSYRPGLGWSAPRRVTVPDCALDRACELLNAAPTAQGWELRYGSAPLRPADPQRVAAEIVVVDPSGAGRTVQTIALERDPASLPAAYNITPEGNFQWLDPADRSAGGVLNYRGRPLFRQRADGLLEALPELPAGLLQPPARRAPEEPQMNPLGASYLLTDRGLGWRPVFSPTLVGLEVERATLFDDRWVAVHETDRGIALEARPADAAATPTGRAVRVLGRQAELTALEETFAPLLRAPDGTYWLLGPTGETLHLAADLRRLDGRNVADRLRLLFVGFFGFYEGGFHTSSGWLKAGGLALMIVGWPLAMLVLVLWRRAKRPNDAEWFDRVLRVAVGYIVVAAVFARWFWTASGYL